MSDEPKDSVCCCIPHYRKPPKPPGPPAPPPLKILLTNGRFPVSIDLARQLRRAGHTVYCVDPMHYHVCKFSNSVKKSWWVKAPHVNPTKYVEGIIRAIQEVDIDLVIPMHEEGYYLAEVCWFGGFTDQRILSRDSEDDERAPVNCGRGDRQDSTLLENPFSPSASMELNRTTISRSTTTASSNAVDKRRQPILTPANIANLRAKLLAPPFPTLIMLHNKYSFTQFLELLGLDHPAYRLCQTKEDVQAVLDGSTPLITTTTGSTGEASAIALKPVFGRACSHVYKLTPGPDAHIPDDLDIDDDNHYIAQEWVKGDRYCTYAIIREGEVRAFGCYPVQDTIDGSSCVYFEAVEHPRIRAYVEAIAAGLKYFTLPGSPEEKVQSCMGFQLALDLVEEVDEDGRKGRLIAIECNPRATSGIHIFSGTNCLSEILTDNFTHPQHKPRLPSVTASKGTKRQLAPGMLMWKYDKSSSDTYRARVKQYLSHMKRLMASKDVMFSARDIWPSVMQPFLLTSYYEICRERNMALPEMFQWDLTWEPRGEAVERARRVVDDEVERRRRWVEEERRASGGGTDSVGMGGGKQSGTDGMAR